MISLCKNIFKGKVSTNYLEINEIKYYTIESDIADVLNNLRNFENIYYSIRDNKFDTDIILVAINNIKDKRNKLNLSKLLIIKLDTELAEYLVEF